MPPQVEIYTLEECEPCRDVKHLLCKQGISYHEYPIKEYRTRYHKVAERLGRIAVPIVVIKERCLDYPTLVQLASAGHLDRLLQAPER